MYRDKKSIAVRAGLTVPPTWRVLVVKRHEFWEADLHLHLLFGSSVSVPGNSDHGSELLGVLPLVLQRRLAIFLAAHACAEYHGTQAAQRFPCVLLLLLLLMLTIVTRAQRQSFARGDFKPGKHRAT